jgi:DNA modification methylase
VSDPIPTDLRPRILLGHVLDRLRELPEGSVQMAVTSPPYWGLRAYGTLAKKRAGQLADITSFGEPVPAPPSNAEPGGATLDRPAADDGAEAHSVPEAQR